MDATNTPCWKNPLENYSYAGGAALAARTEWVNNRGGSDHHSDLCVQRMKWQHYFILAIVVYLLLTTTITEAANEVDYDDLVKPCLNDLVANLIHHEDADGHILYEARESFELTPRRFKAVVAKAKADLADQTSASAEAAEAPWPFINALGNLATAGGFGIGTEDLHLSPIEARYLHTYQYARWTWNFRAKK